MRLILILLCLSTCLVAEDSFADKWLKTQIVKEYIGQKIRSYEVELQLIKQNTTSVAEHVTDMAVAKKAFIINSDREKDIQYNLSRYKKIYDAVMKEEATMREALIVEYMKKLDITFDVEKKLDIAK